MNQNRPIIIGALIGLVVSIVLSFTQNVEAMLYLSGAPHYLDALTLKSDNLVSPVTYLYFIALFSSIGFLIARRLPKKIVAVAIVILIAAHIVLAWQGAHDIFDELPNALSSVRLSKV